MFFLQIITGIILGFISLFYVAQIVVPLFYCVPKSIYLVLKGKLRATSILFWLWPPTLWIAVPFLIGFFYPSLVDSKFFKFIDNPTSSVIANLIVLGMIYSTIFTRKGRQDAKDDFWNSMNKFRKVRSADNVNLENLGATLQFEDGMKLYDMKDFKGAIEKFNMGIAVLELNRFEKDTLPLNYNGLLKEAYYNRGCAKDDLMDYVDAIKDYTKAIDLGNNNAEEYSNRALAKYELKNHEEAIQDYNKAITIDPKKGNALCGRANAKYQTGDKAGACEDWHEAVNLGFSQANEWIEKYCN